MNVSSRSGLTIFQQQIWQPFRSMGLSYDDIDITGCNRLAAKAGLCTDAGIPVQFDTRCHSRLSALEYEAKIAQTGLVPTRLNSWHDYYNACCWLRYPRLKACFNAIHVAEGREYSDNSRSGLRNVITHLDESGAIVISDSVTLLRALAAQEWGSAFVHPAWNSTRCVLLGHGMLEQGRKPFPGITAKALLVYAHGARSVTEVDVALARIASSEPTSVSQWPVHPLPLRGVPGFWEKSDQKTLVSNVKEFRPRLKPLSQRWTPLSV